MVDFKTFKKNSSNLDRLAKEIDKINNPETSYEKDDRYWQPTVDKAGNGFAVIRFLPAPKVDNEGKDLPWVRMFSHGFQGPTGQWYIENNRTTLGNSEKDPVSEFNSALWSSSTDDEGPERTQVRKQKRKLAYISNIYILKDPANPENEGKIFLYKYGKKIFDKISEMMHPPEIEKRDGIDPYNFWTGANFKLSIKKVKGYRNYDSSQFETPAPLFDEDDRLEKIWESEFSLVDEIAPRHFKSYEDLKARLEHVLGHPISKVVATASNDEEDKPEPKARSTPKASAKKAEETPPWEAGGASDDEDLNYFKNLVKED